MTEKRTTRSDLSALTPEQKSEILIPAGELPDARKIKKVDKIEENVGNSSSDEFQSETEEDNTMANTNHAIRLRDAIELVPNFTGEKGGVNFRQFAAGCEDAKNMLPASAEGNLVLLLKSRLRNNAAVAVRGMTFATVKELIEALRKIYPSPESTADLYGELSNLCQHANEKVASYYSRARDLEVQLITAYKHENGNEISDTKNREIKKACCKAFIRGLIPQIFAFVRGETDLNDAGPMAIQYEIELESQNRLHQQDTKEQCVICDSIEHKAMNCGILKNIKVTKSCQLCHKDNHIASECRSSPCQICNKYGHVAKNCQFRMNTGFIQQNTNTAGGVNCYSCGKRGHMAKFCKQRQNEMKTNITCFYCGKRGHMQKDCYKRSGQRNQNYGNKECYYCHKMGHTQNVCFLRNRQMSENGKTLPSGEENHNRKNAPVKILEIEDSQ